MTSMFNVCLFKSHYKIPLSRYSLNMDCLIDLLWINSTMKLRLSGVLAPIVCCHRRTIESGLGSCVTEWLQMHTAAAHSECSYEDDRRLTPSLLDICNVHLTPKSTRHHCWPQPAPKWVLWVRTKVPFPAHGMIPVLDDFRHRLPLSCLKTGLIMFRSVEIIIVNI